MVIGEIKSAMLSGLSRCPCCGYYAFNGVECFDCGYSIRSGSLYRDGGYGRRAHTSCVRAALKGIKEEYRKNK
jgi:ribosomal protein L32